MKPLRSWAGEQKTLTSPLRMMKPLRSRGFPFGSRQFRFAATSLRG